MKKLLLILLILFAGIALWAIRPGATYAPLTMLSLLDGEKRIENFLHMERIFPFVSLAPSSQPFSFPVADSFQEHSSTVFPVHFDAAQGRYSFKGFLDTTQTVGLQVYRGGELIGSYFHESLSDDQPYTSWSIAKSIIATGIARAVQQGKLASLESRVGELVPGLADSDWSKVTVRNLLTMSTGIAFDERYHEPFSDIRQLFYRTFMFRQPVRQTIAELDSYRAQGTKLDYISINTVVLAWVLEAATGQSVPDYLQQALWEPLGMQDSALVNVDFDGFPAAFCCMSLSARDYAKLGQLYLQQGQWQEQQLLPESWVQDATRRPEPWLAAGNLYPERGYGYHLWVPKDPDGEYFFNGVWGQTVWVDEHADMVIVKLGADPDYLNNMALVIDFMRATTKPYRNLESHTTPDELETNP